MRIVTIYYLIASACFAGVFCEQWQQLRNKTLAAKVCLDYLNKHRDLCEHQQRNGVYFKYNSSEVSGEERICRCDELCETHKDCCVDKHSSLRRTDNETNEEIDWFCSEIPTSKYSASVYTVQSCLKQWKNTEIEKMCRDEKIGGHISSTLVYSETSKLFYRNYFCALCNDDSLNLTQTKSRIVCTKNFNLTSITTNDVRKYLNANTYNHTLRQWRFKYGDENAFCSFSIEDFDTYNVLSTKFNARLCVNAIDTCSLYEDANCKAYASYIYERTRSVWPPPLAYKNYHCALCNGAEKKRFTCDTPLRHSKQEVIGISFSLLFDFNFSKGRLVGRDVRIKCRLVDGFVFDSITSQCVQMYCGQSFRQDERSGQCVRLDDSESGISSPCPKVMVNKDNFDLLENGSIVLYRNDVPLITDEYEVYSSRDGTVERILVCAEKRYLFYATLSFSKFQHILSTVVLTISSICLILHLSVFAFVPKLRNEPGKCVASMAIALLLGNLSFIAGTELTPNYKQISFRQRGSEVCVLMSVIMHYSFLSATFWMNVMSFDVSATFKRTIRVARCKFWSYSLYAWLVPAAIVSLSGLLDLTTKDSTFKPMYGYTVCWISQRVPLVTFFVLPVLVLLVMNYVFFGITIKGLKRSRKQTKIVKQTNTDDPSRVYMYIKLAVLMGLTWITGIIAALLDSELLWICFIVLNGSQGSLLFFLFTCKRSVYEKIKQKSFSSSRLSEDTKSKSISLTQVQTTRRSTDSLNSNRIVKMDPL